MIEALSTLKAGAAELGLDLSLTQLDQLMAYLGLIQKWNKVYNLTAVRDPQEMLNHHLLDSLTRRWCATPKAGQAKCWTWARAAVCPASCWRAAGPNLM